MFQATHQNVKCTLVLLNLRVVRRWNKVLHEIQGCTRADLADHLGEFRLAALAVLADLADHTCVHGARFKRGLQLQSALLKPSCVIRRYWKLLPLVKNVIYFSPVSE